MAFPYTKKRDLFRMSRICQICGCNETNRLGSVDSYILLECAKCGLQFIDPVPNHDSLNSIYSDYFKAWDIKNFQKEVSSMKLATFRRYLKQIGVNASDCKLLDVGCATGELLQAAQEAGYDVFGVEVSPYGIERCKKKFGENKISGCSLKKGDFPPEFFDVITLSDVLEHMVDPRSFLDILWTMLKPDGILMTVTPDTRSFTRRLMGMKWLHYKEEHIFYYNRSNISLLFAPKFKVLTQKTAYKNLTLNYCASVINGYINHSYKRFFTYLIQLLPFYIRHFPFPINIGEMFILCRKVKE